MLLPGIGEAGQAMLAASHAMIVGCGALGCAIADMLARAGVGTLTIIDRDIVELTNLQRQTLFDQQDADEGTPKAEAAKARLAQVNAAVNVHAHVDDFNHLNAERLAEGADIVIDGLDNFETRYLLNDLAVSRGMPYIYGGAVSTTGMSMCMLPHHTMREGSPTSNVRWTEEQSTPCLRCVFPEAPPPGSTPTCDTAGVLGPIIMIIAAHQATQAIKLLTGNVHAIDRALLSIDCWRNDIHRFDVSNARNPDCPCCAGGKFDHLRGERGQLTSTLCGRDAVQISPPAPASPQSPPSTSSADEHALDLAACAQRLSDHGTFTCNRFLLRGMLRHEHSDSGKPIELTLFPNGRAILKGVNSIEHARTLYAKYIGM